MNIFKQNKLLIFIAILFGPQFLFAQPTLQGIENSLPDEKHPFAFSKDQKIFHSKDNPFVKRLLALNPGLEYLENIPNTTISSLHKLSFDGSTYLFKDAFLGPHSLQLSQKFNRITDLPHVMDIFGMKSIRYDANDDFHFLQLMEFLPGQNLEKEQKLLENNCSIDLETNLLNLVSQLHSTVTELSSIGIFCGDEVPSNYVFKGIVLKRVDVERDCYFLNGEEPKLSVQWLEWAKGILSHCKRSTEKIDSIIERFKKGEMKNYIDLNNAILKVL